MRIYTLFPTLRNKNSFFNNKIHVDSKNPLGKLALERIGMSGIFRQRIKRGLLGLEIAETLYLQWLWRNYFCQINITKKSVFNTAMCFFEEFVTLSTTKPLIIFFEFLDFRNFAMQ